MTLQYFTDASLPNSAIWWFQSDRRTLWDFSAGGWTFAGRIFPAGGATLVTLAGGQFTGAAGSGVEPTGVPNLVIAYTAGQLSAVSPGPYRIRVTGTLGGKNLVMVDDFLVSAD